MKKVIFAVLLAIGVAGLIPAHGAPRKNVDRTSGTTVLKPNYLNEKTAGFARPFKVTYTACIVKPAMESSIWEKPQFTMACMKSEDELKWERAPMLRSRGQTVSGLGLAFTRLSPETQYLLALESATKPNNPTTTASVRAEVSSKVSSPTVVRIDKSGFLTSTQIQPTLSADCCGGSQLPLTATRKTISGILR